MKLTRRDLLATSAAAIFLPSPPLRAREVGGEGIEPQPARKQSPLGIVIHSLPIRAAESRRRKDAVPFGDAQRFVEYCRDLGAAGAQVGIGARDKDSVAKLRKTAEDAGMYLEGSIRLPQDRADVARFDAEVRTAKDAGAVVLRTVASSGRRYETFESAEAFSTFARQAHDSLTLAEPVVAKHDVKLAIENHKDWRVGELVDLVKRISSKHVGVCLDFGNSIALLEDPTAVVAAYAPWTFTTHLKDMAVAEYEDGFLLSEVPLGTGFLDIQALVAVVRKAHPDVRLNLEMITRDPLKVPCLTRKYWETLDGVGGRELADALVRVRKNAAKDLPRVSGLSPEKQLAAEDDNIRRCFEYAAQRLRV
jgi:sugar phosphate isomerase/epimerase